jgi:hypothetical protein
VSEDEAMTQPPNYGPNDTVVYPDLSSLGAPHAVPSHAPRSHRPRVGFVLIAAAVLVLAGGAVATYLLGGPFGDRGADTPGQAVDGFLTGIYGSHDAQTAGRYVCGRARDDAELDQIISQVSQQQAGYPGQRTTWSYPQIQPDGQQATARVTLTMTTADERIASRQVNIALVDDRGWWVCDVRAG